MTKPFMAPSTAKHIKAFINRPTSVLLLEGLSGSGKRSIAQYVARTVLAIGDTTYAYLFDVEPENNSLSIEQIRAVQKQLVRSVPGSNPWRRAIIIHDADRLTLEAQNALLKSLEEPPADTLFILTVQQRSNLLPTVLSRTQIITVGSLSKKAAMSQFGASDTVDKAYQMSQGRIGLLTALLEESNHPLVADISLAKQIIGFSQYDRLVRVQTLSKGRQEVIGLLDALHLIATASLHVSVKAGKNDQARRWQTIRKQVAEAQKALMQNANPKLVLTDLFVHI